MEVVELKVNLHCRACEMSTRKMLSKLKGVTCVDIDVVSNKVTVLGYIDQKTVVKAVRKTGRKAEVRSSYRPEPKILKRSTEVAARYKHSPRAPASKLAKQSKERPASKALQRIQCMLCMRTRAADDEEYVMRRRSLDGRASNLELVQERN